MSAVIESLPVCHLCGREVDRMWRLESCVPDGVVFIVECHGDRETVRLSTADLMRARGQLRPGVAFLPPPKELMIR